MTYVIWTGGPTSEREVIFKQQAYEISQSQYFYVFVLNYRLTQCSGWNITSRYSAPNPHDHCHELITERCSTLDNCVAHERDKRHCSKSLALFECQSVTYPPIRSGVRADHTAGWFSHANADATRSRDQLAEDSLDMLIQWLKEGGNVGIHGERLLRSSPGFI